MKFFCVLITVAATFHLQFHAALGQKQSEIAKHVNVTFTRHTDELTVMQLRDLEQLFSHKSFNATLPTVVYVHGWIESGKFDLSTNAIRGAYVDRGDHNVVTVDWSYYSKTWNYIGIAPKVQAIAETIAEEIIQLVRKGCDIKKLHLVGHSLGGQMVGLIGRYLQEVPVEKILIPRIYALDPAGPLFEENNEILLRNPDVHEIRKTDAAYVQIIHTNGHYLGMHDRVAHADFYPDGGIKHPGCDVDVPSTLLKELNPCNHFRSWHFYQETVRNPQAFPAVKCNSYDDFIKKNCYYNEIEYMGFGANLKSGKYFLQTNSNMFSLSRGRKGLVHTPTKVTCLSQRKQGTCENKFF